jgi:hypothetical protein
MLSNVDFPHPLGPTMQTNSPCATSASMFSSTRMESPFFFPAKRIERFRIETAFILKNGECRMTSKCRTPNAE